MNCNITRNIVKISGQYLIACLLLLLTACGTDVDQQPVEITTEQLKIGLLAPKSGPLAGFGLSMEQSARLAVSEINESGGVNGQQIGLLVRDTRLGLPNFLDTSQQVTKDLIDQDVTVIIGPAGSGTTLAIAPQTIAAGIPLITPSATSPELTNLADNNLIWRTTASDAFQGVFLADQIFSQNIQTLAIIYRDDAYGRGLKDAITENFNALGGSVVASVSYSADQQDNFTPQIEQVLSNGPVDALVIVSFAIDGSNIAISLANNPPQPMPKLFGVDGNFLQSFLDNAPSQLVVGMQGSAPTAPASLSTYIAFKEKYQQTFGKAAEPFTESVYDAVYLAAISMLVGDENTSQSIVNNLQPVSKSDSPQPLSIEAGITGFQLAKNNLMADLDYLGASGEIDFDQNGDVTSGNYVLWQIVDNNGTLSFEIVTETPFP